MKKSFSLVQHWLIPLALMAVNVALIHFIYLLATIGLHMETLYLFLCLSSLIVAIIFKEKYLLITSTTIYLIVIIVLLNS